MKNRVLFIFLGVVLLTMFITAGKATAQYVDPDTMPFTCLGACTTSSPVQSAGGTVTVNTDVSPTPCPTEANVSANHNRGNKNARKKYNGKKNTVKKKKNAQTGKQNEKDGLLQLFLKFLEILLQLLGGGTVPTAPKVETPVTPTPNTSNPCDSVTPTEEPAPTDIPDITDGPTPSETSVGANLQPRASVPRPGGGSWSIAFQDEFDGSGGTDASAMSGANFVNKTVGGGALAGNPGLNPRKWNMGWYTGPSTLTGLGNVTKITAWGREQTQWWGPESIVFPGDGAVHLRSQRRTWTSYNNEMGMITTAGLYASNPANSSHGNVPADRFIDGPQIIEWTASGTFVTDWPSMWMTNAGNFGSIGSQWPGGTTYSEEIDLVEPIFRLHKASEFQKGKQVVPSGWDNNAKLTWTWYFDSAKIILWVSNESGQTVKMFELPDSEVSASMISVQWKYPQYLLFAQQTKLADAADGDMVIDYVRIWK